MVNDSAHNQRPYGRRSYTLALDCSPAIKTLGIFWILLPLAGVFILPLFDRGDSSGLVLQESWITFRTGLVIGGSWMLVGLGLVPLLGVHGSSLAKALLLAVGWSATAGAWWAPPVVALRYRPAASAVGEPAEFRPSGDARISVVVSPTSGEAASARFMVPKKWWNEAYARAGNRPVKGKVYKGGRNLWFASFDDVGSP